MLYLYRKKPIARPRSLVSAEGISRKLSRRAMHAGVKRVTALQQTCATTSGDRTIPDLRLNLTMKRRRKSRRTLMKDGDE